VSYTLSAAANVTVNLVSPAGTILSTLLTAQKPAGLQKFAFTPTPGLPNGSYAIVVNATAGLKTATATVGVTVDDILSGFVAMGPSMTFTLTREPVALAFQVLRGKQVVAAPPAPAPVVGPQTLTWDGHLDDGSRAPDGTYTLVLAITDDVSTFQRTTTVTLDTVAPRITVLSYRNLRFRISEPALLTLVVGTKHYTRVLKKATATQFWLKTKPLVYRLPATDAAGNTTTVRYRR
jgi:hypothetical protein